MPFPFRCLCHTLFPKLSEIRICHHTEETGSGPTQQRGREDLFPPILVAPFQQKERRCRRCRERVEICGFSGHELPHLGRTRDSRSAVPRDSRADRRWPQWGPAVPGSAAHGGPGGGQPGLRATGEELRGRGEEEGFHRPGAGLTAAQDLPRCRVSARRCGAGGGAEPRSPPKPCLPASPGRAAPSGLPGTPPFPSRSPPPAPIPSASAKFGHPRARGGGSGCPAPAVGANRSPGSSPG